MTALLRPAQPGDLAALCQLEQLCFTTDHFNRRQLSHLLNRAHAITWVAEDEARRLVGYATLLLRRNSLAARLYSFCVHPDVQGQGVGRRLLDTLESEVRERGCEWLTLEVRADNRRARALYRRMGFGLRRWLDDYYADGCAAWQMEKSLLAPDTGRVVNG
ncbi:MAG: ribosomal protein S18-alanine N-acetyltransferase [Onishia taeanensis]|uniref:Ribosomal-protein-alanine acetyltransferase n=1 Tax=Onishia taeanensis TaxID=284577 RepID=A0A328Y1B0_9GAMM|nr:MULTISPECIES: ribosomal protein S18-alanine N-acetyltransferase [Halomonas]RAR62104.1 ribosomal-protein-alanine acetyltransferase [Halomonas taeanensis]